MALQAADDTLLFALQETLDVLELTEEDTAAERLAALYAAAIDADPTSLADLGPKMLATLEALGASPRARAQMLRKQGPGITTELAKLRAARIRQG